MIEKARPESRRSSKRCNNWVGVVAAMCGDTRWGEDVAERERQSAADLIALGPHVILASGTLSVTAKAGPP